MEAGSRFPSPHATTTYTNLTGGQWPEPGTKERGSGIGPYYALLAAHGLRAPKTASALRLELARNKNLWLTRPLPPLLCSHAGDEAEALLALGERLQARLTQEAVLAPLARAQAALMEFVR